jgi:hypothetical protein
VYAIIHHACSSLAKPPQVRPVAVLVDAAHVLSLPPFPSIVSGAVRLPAPTRAPRTSCRVQSSRVPFRSRSGSSPPRPRLRASSLLLHEALDHGLEVEVGRCQVGDHCGILVNTRSQWTVVGEGGGETHPPCPRSRWVPPWSWRRPPWPGLLTSACARTRAAPRPPSATS